MATPILNFFAVYLTEVLISVEIFLWWSYFAIVTILNLEAVEMKWIKPQLNQVEHVF